MDRLLADPDKISQVVTNRLRNACHYTPTGGFVRIYTQQASGEMKVTFANTGGELSQKDFPFIFEQFYRGEKSRSREHGGAGIGLASVKELIEAHDGMLEPRFVKTKPGSGFLFLHDLPTSRSLYIIFTQSLHVLY